MSRRASRALVLIWKGGSLLRTSPSFRETQEETAHGFNTAGGGTLESQM